MARIKCPGCRQVTNDLETMGFCEHCGQSAVATDKPEFTDEVAEAEAMAGAKTTVTLEGSDGRVRQMLPRLCICCGEPDVEFLDKTFTWYPRWIYLLAGLGYLPFLILMLLTRQIMTVELPLCHRHRYPMIWGIWFLLAFLAYGFSGCLVAFLAAAIEKDWGRGHPLGLAIWCGWLGGFVVLIVLGFVLRRKSFHIKHITADGITIGGVSELFAEKLGKERRF